MTSTLGFSDFEPNISNHKNKRKAHSKTRKRNHKVTSKKVEQFLNFMNNNSEENENNNNESSSLGQGANLGRRESSLGEFNPPSPPQLTKFPEESKENEITEEIDFNKMAEDDNDDDGDVNIESFNTMESNVINNEYYKQYLSPQMQQMASGYAPTFNSMSNVPALAGNSDPNDLMKKLNYMIHLLEEQQDEKTETVTEELILYMFLGVFVIFVCDSFARAGKYTR